MASQSRSEASWLTDDISCETHLKVVKLTYTWIVHDFSMRLEETGKKIRSSTFSTAGQSNKWCLELWPNGEDAESKDFVSLRVRRLASSENDDVLAKYRFSVLSQAGRETNVTEATARFARGAGWGWKKFIRRDSLLKVTGTDHLLPNDKLTIYCEVLAFGDSVNTSSQNASGAVSVPDCHLSQDFGNLLASRRFSDVIFSVEGKEVHAHKLILACRCPVFASMFEHEMKENKQGRVEITDCDFEVLHEVLEFIYTGRAPKLNEMADKILVAANKYDLGRLKAMCEDVLCLKLSEGTAAETLVLADMHNADQLKVNALRFIKEHGAGVVETDGWKMMAQEKPHLVAEAFRAVMVETVAPKTGFGSQ